MKIILNLPEGSNLGLKVWAANCAEAFAKDHVNRKPGPWGGAIYQTSGFVAQVHWTVKRSVVVTVCANVT